MSICINGVGNRTVVVGVGVAVVVVGIGIIGIVSIVGVAAVVESRCIGYRDVGDRGIGNNIIGYSGIKGGCIDDRVIGVGGCVSMQSSHYIQIFCLLFLVILS